MRETSVVWLTLSYTLTRDATCNLGICAMTRKLLVQGTMIQSAHPQGQSFIPLFYIPALST